MLYKILIPSIILGLLSLTMISAVMQSNQVEYFDNYEPSAEFLTSVDKSKRKNLKPQLIKKQTQAKQVAINRTRFESKKALSAKTTKTQTKKKNKKIVSKSLKKSKQSKRKFREPSEVQRKRGQDSLEKFIVPEDLPQVVQPIYYSSGAVTSADTHIVDSDTGQLNTIPQVNSGTSHIVIDNNQDEDTVVTIQETDIESSTLLSSAALAALNEQLEATQQVLAPGLTARIQAEVKTAIENELKGRSDFKVLEYQSIDSNLSYNSLGVSTLGRDSLALELPRVGDWWMKIKMKIHYQNDLFESTEDIIIHLTNLKLRFQAKAVHDSSGRFYFYEALAPKFTYDISFQSTSFLTNIIFEIFHLFMPNYLDASIQTAATHLKMNLKTLVDKTKSPIRSSFKGIYQEATPVNLAGIVENIDAKINTHHQYAGTIHAYQMSQSSNKSWKDAYSVGGEGIKGVKVKPLSLNSSAKLSGQYLASLAFKYAVKKDKATLTHIKKTLAGIDKLLLVHNYTGLLARSITPLNSRQASELIAGGMNIGSELISGQINGTQYLAVQGENGISRDQYSAVLFGLATTYDSVTDVIIKNKIKYLIRIMLDYLIEHHFIFEADRRALVSPGNTNHPSIWEGAKHYQLAYLMVGKHILPDVYSTKFEQIAHLAQSSWLTTFFKVINPIEKYKQFHTLYTEIYTYLRFETNSERKQDMLKNLRMLDYYLGAHKNSFFDTITASYISGALLTKLNPIKVSLYKLLNRPHRKVRNPLLDTSEIKTSMQLLPTGNSVMMSTHILAPEYRALTTDSVWEKSAHLYESQASQNDKEESLGVDVTLPYWMAKYHQLY